jgi:hypothetical protein
VQQPKGTPLMTNLSQLATADRLSLEIADTRGEIKFTKLPTRKPRRAELIYTSGHRSGGYRASGVKVRGGSGCNAAVPTSQWLN